MATSKTDIWLDRTVEGDLVNALKPGGHLRSLVEFRNNHQDLIDLQFRRPSRLVSRVSLYAGMTRIIDVDVRASAGWDAKSRFHIAHETHRRMAQHYPAWNVWQSLGELAGRWPQVEEYLVERMLWFDSAEGAHHVIEGRVHAAMCSDSVTSFRVLNREASPTFRSNPVKVMIGDPIRHEMRRVLDAVPKPRAWLKYHAFGTSADILAVDDTGRLIVAEAKPFGSRGIVKGPIQARFYAGLICKWLELNSSAPEALRSMLEQRIAVGLSRGPAASFHGDVPIVPVVAIGPGEVSPRALKHAVELRDALVGLAPSEAGATEQTEIWRLNVDGDIEAKI